MKLSKRHFAGFLMAIALQTQLGLSAMANEEVLKFTTHDIDIKVFSASDVYLVYAGSPHRLSFGKVFRAKTPEDVSRFRWGTSGSYNAFAGPVEMEWRSQDGTPFKYSLNLDEIFKERRILHTEEISRLYKAEPVYGGKPTIIIEVNDRTVNVYMFVTMRLEKDEQTREHRDHLTLAFTKTF